MITDFKRGRTISGHVLITGGAGFIGSHLTERLLRQGHHVVVLDDLSTGRRENLEALDDQGRLRFVEGSVLDERLVERLAAGATKLFHLAAVVGVRLVIEDPLRVIEENIWGTRSVLEAARRHRVPTFVASTSEIYGKNPQVPFTEESDRVLGSPACSRWSYSTSKAVDEILALGFHRRYGFPVVIARLFNTVGPRQVGEYGMVLPRFVRQVVDGKPITVFGDGLQRRSFCDVRDVVRAIDLLMATPAAVGEIFNIGGDEEISILELAERVIAGAPHALPPHLRSSIRFVSYEEAYGPGYEEFPRRVPVTGKLTSLTGWRQELCFAETLDSLFASVAEKEGRPVPAALVAASQ